MTSETVIERIPVPILYTNWRGETAVRKIIPHKRHPMVSVNPCLWFGRTQWHPEPQWFLTAVDVEKGAVRDWALSGIKAWGEEAVSAALASTAGDGAGDWRPTDKIMEISRKRLRDIQKAWADHHALDEGNISFLLRMAGCYLREAPAVPASPRSGAGEGKATKIDGKLYANVSTQPFQCPHCDCRSYARVSERKGDGAFRPGLLIRCVECKTVYRDANAVEFPIAAPAEHGVEPQVIRDIARMVREKAEEIRLVIDRHTSPRGAGIYMASKTAHAPEWRRLRAEGLPIISTWIDEAGKGETACFTDLWQRCVDEAATASVVIVYRQPGEVLKGAFVEAGAALACGVPVLAVGCDEFSFSNHAGVERLGTLHAALDRARQILVEMPALSQGGGAGRSERAAMLDAITQARGALHLDAMKDEAGKPYGTTTAALEALAAAEKALSAVSASDAALASQRYWSGEAVRAAGALSEANQEIERLEHNLDVAKQERDAAFNRAKAAEEALHRSEIAGRSEKGEGRAEGRPRLLSTTDDLLASIRADGWAVAVHNDYRLAGEARTFWLFTHSDGRWIKGEGRTDIEAIKDALTILSAAPAQSPSTSERKG